MSTIKHDADDFLFSGVAANDETMSVFDKKETNTDGIYRPLLKDAKDKKVGYKATLRFLPNLLETGSIGPSAIQKHIHYVDFQDKPKLKGYYDCRKNHEANCELCTEYWRLYNSKNQADVEKSKLINRTTKYYSYVLILEDDQHPDLVGKIMIYPYGYTIKEKIKSEKEGELTGEECNIFDIVNGKDFRLIIKEKGGYQNYESSSFLEVSPLKIYSEKHSKFLPIPVAKLGDDKVKKTIKNFLLERDVNLDEHKPVEWDEEMIGKSEQVIAVLRGNDEYLAEQSSKGNDTTNIATESPISSEETDADSFFELDDDDE